MVIPFDEYQKDQKVCQQLLNKESQLQPQKEIDTAQNIGTLGDPHTLSQQQEAQDQSSHTSTSIEKEIEKEDEEEEEEEEDHFRKGDFLAGAIDKIEENQSVDNNSGKKQKNLVSPIWLVP